MRKLLGILIVLLCASAAYGAPATMYVTSAGGGDKSGEPNWANAMGLAEFEADLEAFTEQGDVYYVKANAIYTVTSAIAVANDGTAALPIKIIGVKTGTTAEPPTYADWAFGDDRPLFSSASVGIAFDNYTQLYNLRFTMNDTTGARIDTGSMMYNCKSLNSSGTAGYKAMYVAGAAMVIGCEAQSTNGDAIALLTGGTRIINSYVHDSNSGIVTVVDGAVILNNVIDTCVWGIEISSTGSFGTVIGNTIYGCTVGIEIDGTPATGNWLFLNNIIDNCSTAEAEFATAQGTMFWDWNCWGEAVPTRTNITAGNNDIDADPGMAGAASGDFTVGSGSVVLDVGMQVGTNQGATGDYKVNIGVDQDDNAAGGGGGQRVIGGGVVK
jgi:hypothetical protein